MPLLCNLTETPNSVPMLDPLQATLLCAPSELLQYPVTETKGI